MSVQTIIEYPDPILSEPAAPVETFDGALETLITDLIDTLRDGTGIGLCAPQIGAAQQVIVIEEDTEPQVFINPKLVRTAVPCIVEERCLSLPGLKGHVLRSAQATVVYQTQEGAREERELSGMPAVCLQHEIEHLEGRLFLERLTRIRQWWYKRGLQKRRLSGPRTTAA